jgi:hypothetical protein
MPRHKLPAAPRRGRLVAVFTAVFGLIAGLALVVTYSPAPSGASTVALSRPSVSAWSSRNDVAHWRHRQGVAHWRYRQGVAHWGHHWSPSPSQSSSTPVTALSSPSSSPSTTTPSPTSSRSPAPSTPTSSGPPSASPSPNPTSGQVMPTGVPASQVGKLLVNDTGDDLASWPRWTAYGAGGTMTHSNGVLDLSTSGANANGYSIISPDSYTSGIFEARVYFPGASDGEIADWPAFWISSTPYTAVAWPDGGEMDLAEGLSGTLSATYHYGANGTPQQTTSFPVTSAPGWHVVTGVWTTGRWDVYYDGKLVKTISGSYVVNDPMKILVSAYTGQYGHLPGQPSTVQVSYLRVWSLAGS